MNDESMLRYELKFACAVGAFHDDRVKEVLSLAADEFPQCIMPVGRK